MQNIVTAEFLWRQHRAALGGRSRGSGAPRPGTLAECPPGAQAARWGMAAAVSRLLGQHGALTPDELLIPALVHRTS